MTEENRSDAVRAETLLGDDALRAAKSLLDLGLPNDAVSRAYYAAFHYARALLLTRGLEPKTHRGVIDVLIQQFERTGQLRPEVASSLARLQTFRGLADYDARHRLNIERACDEVTAAGVVVAEIGSVLRGGGWLG